MKKAVISIAVLLVATAALAQRPMTYEDLAAIKRIGAPHVSPDGKWIAYDISTTDMVANGRTSTIHLIPADGSAAPRAITDGTKSDSSPAWSPNGKSIAYISNREGGRQLHLYDIVEATSRKVSSLPSGAGSPQWLPDGSAIVVSTDVYPDCGVDAKCHAEQEAAAAKSPTKARLIHSLFYRHWTSWTEPTRSHAVLVPLDGSGVRDLTPGAFAAGEVDVSPDGKEIAFVRNTDPRPELSTNSDIFVVPTAGGDAKRITTRTGADSEPVYSPDGRWIAWHSQSRAGYEADLWELWLYDRENGTSKRIAADFNDSLGSLTWAVDSKSIFATASLKGKTALYEIALNGRMNLLNSSGSIDTVEVARDGKTLFFSMTTLRRPNEIYSITRGVSAAPKKLTRDNDQLLTGIELGATSDLWWTGAENARVQGHLIKPPAFDPTKKYPAIVLIHGGPQGAWGDSWSYRWNPQMFAARGYVVLMPNPRGSSGFGQPFLEQVSGDWGGRAYTDIMNGVDAFVALPYVDGTRLGAAGASYGGYMVNWILGHDDRFKALVSHAGVYNLESMYGVTEELWFPEWEFGGNPWDNPEQYTKWSPHRYAKNFKTPTLVVHGELDFRVPIGEGLQLFTALQRKGVPSSLLYFPDEGHWVLKPQNSKLWHQTVLDWFDRWLKPAK
ncbi:MAG: S9 family peptidase [Thermoanaerobaculia bacterium]